MSNQKPSLPKGTRDFGPEVMSKRTYLLDTIKAVFQRFGFQPLETPTMENLSVLTGKYGDEGDQLLYKVLDSGDFYSSINPVYTLSNEDVGRLTITISNVIDHVHNQIEQGGLTQQPDTEDSVEDQERSQVERFIKEWLVGQSSNIDFSTSTFYNILNNDELIKRFAAAVLVMETQLQTDKIKSGEDNYTKWRDETIYKQILPNLDRTDSRKNTIQSMSSYVTPYIASKGLRYDLTVPFARYVVMNQHSITFPFRRYQVQPVWRADRPQKGRYREFYQCDADVVGTDALLCEAEIILMLEEVFAQLKLTDYTIKINDRRLLHGLVEMLGVPDKETDLLVAIDKLDKIGEEKVLDELRGRGFDDQAIEQLKPVFRLSGTNEDQLATVAELLKDSSVGQAGIAALREVMDTARSLGSSLEHLSFDLTLARGLSYYTGAIFEVKSNQGSLRSSISGGGRYDNLTGGFGLLGVSGVGISFGVDRIYDVLDELSLFPEASQVSTRVLFVNFDRSLEAQVLPLLSQVRRAGVAAELYPEAVKMKKQFAYADKKGIPYAVVVGTEELAKGAYGLKNLRTGEQEALSLAAIIEQLKQ